MRLAAEIEAGLLCPDHEAQALVVAFCNAAINRFIHAIRALSARRPAQPQAIKVTARLLGEILTRAARQATFAKRCNRARVQSTDGSGALPGPAFALALGLGLIVDT